MEPKGIRRLWQFDTRGLDRDQIRTLYLIIIAVFGGTSWKNITTGVAMTGYLKALGMSDFLYGVVIALPSVANAFQFLVSYMVERRWNRETTFRTAGLIQRLSWILFGLVPFVIPMEEGPLRIWAAAFLALVSAAMQPATVVNSMSIFADVVPDRIRGQYFAIRSRLATLVALCVGLCVGTLMDALPAFTNYLVIFSIAGVIGTLDILLFFFMKIPPQRKQVSGDGMGAMLGRVFRDKNYMRLCAFAALSFFATYLSLPYFTVYMNATLRLSGLAMVCVHELLASAVSIGVVGLWGRGMDRFGHKPVLLMTTLLGAFVPLIWAFAAPGQVWIAVAAQLLYGLQWNAMNLSAQNLYLELSPVQGRTMYIAVFYLASQLLGSFLGSAAGGWLLDNVLFRLESLNLCVLGVSFTRYNNLFILSFVLRLAACAFLPRVREKGSASLRQMLGDRTFVRGTR